MENFQKYCSQLSVKSISLKYYKLLADKFNIIIYSYLTNLYRNLLNTIIHGKKLVQEQV